MHHLPRPGATLLFALLMICGTAGPAAAQRPQLVLRGGLAFPMGDYAHSAEGSDLYARMGWSGGAELRMPMVENMYLFASVDRISNPVDEGELEAAIGIMEPLYVDPHVVYAGFIGLGLEGSLPPLTVRGHAGVGRARLDLADYGIDGGNEARFEAAGKMAVVAGFGVTYRRFDVGFRFYPLGTFHSEGSIETPRESFPFPDEVRAPVKVVTLTVGVILF